MFGPWHRPYLYHFELGLQMAAARVAASFVNATEAEAMLELSPTLRLHYWDWSNG